MSFGYGKISNFFGAIIASISEETQMYVTACSTSLEAWSKLEERYARPSRGQILGIKARLAALIGARKILNILMTSKQRLMNMDCGINHLMTKI